MALNPIRWSNTDPRGTGACQIVILAYNGEVKVTSLGEVVGEEIYCWPNPAMRVRLLSANETWDGKWWWVPAPFKAKENSP